MKKKSTVNLMRETVKFHFCFYLCSSHLQVVILDYMVRGPQVLRLSLVDWNNTKVYIHDVVFAPSGQYLHPYEQLREQGQKWDKYSLKQNFKSCNSTCEKQKQKQMCWVFMTFSNWAGWKMTRQIKLENVEKYSSGNGKSAYSFFLNVLFFPPLSPCHILYVTSHHCPLCFPM